MIATATNTVTTTIPVASRPTGISLTPDGAEAYVVTANSIFVIATTDNTVQAMIPDANYPSGFGIFIQPATPQLISPSILQITPKVLPASSPPATLRIIGNSLAGTLTAPCSGPAETVTWNTTPLNISAASDNEIDVVVPANLLTSIGTYTVTVSVDRISGSSCESLTASGTVQVTSPPLVTLGVSPSSLSFSASAGSLPAPQSVQVTSTSGTLSLTTAVQYGGGVPGWIVVSPGSGSTAPGSPVNLTISIQVWP